MMSASSFLVLLNLPENTNIKVYTNNMTVLDEGIPRKSKARPELTLPCVYSDQLSKAPNNYVPSFIVCDIKVPLNNDHLSTTTTYFGFQGYSMNTNLNVLWDKYGLIRLNIFRCL
jgi:hypothetical protein